MAACSTIRDALVERFDQEAQRAIGAASPLPVPQDNEAFARMSEITIAVEAPERVAPAAPPVKVQPATAVPPKTAGPAQKKKPKVP